MAANLSAPEIARETLKRLLQRKVAPTPEAYTKCYYEVAGVDQEAAQAHPLEKTFDAIINDLQQKTATLKLSKQLMDAHQKKDWTNIRQTLVNALGIDLNANTSWPEAIRELLYQWEFKHENLTQARKREMLEHVLNTFGSDPFKLYPRLRSLIKSWGDQTQQDARTSLEVIESQSEANANSSQASLVSNNVNTMLVSQEPVLEWKPVVAMILQESVSSQLGYSEETIFAMNTLVAQLQNVQQPNEFEEFNHQLVLFWKQLANRGETLEQMIKGLLTLIQLLMLNFQDLNVGEERWVTGQVETVSGLINQPLTPHTLRAAEISFRDFLYRQSSLRKNLQETQDAIKAMVAAFVDQLGAMTLSTGIYSTKFDDYAVQIRKAENLSGLQNVLGDLLTDTRALQADVAKSHHDLLQAQKEAESYQQQVVDLQVQLEEISTLVREDALTTALNRRGLEQAFTAEQARCERKGASCCVALLDIDNFKKLNDTYGHHVGDEALVHLSQVIREVIRPTDALARYGGEEFVIVLPETAIDEAQKIMVRVQRELTKKFFLNQKEKLFITFSAGVAEIKSKESLENVLVRADAAMYEAKRSGKNRVHIAI